MQTVIFVLAVLIIYWFLPRPDNQKHKYDLGHPWSYPTLLAQYDFDVYYSDEAKKEMIDSIDRNFVPVYKVDNSVYEKLVKRINTDSLFTPAMRGELRSAVQKIYSRGVYDPMAINSLELSQHPEKILLLEGDKSHTISFDDLISTQMAALQLADTIRNNPALSTQVALSSINEMLGANLVPDVAATKAAYEDQVRPVNAIIRHVQKDEMLIDRGVIVDQLHYNVLQAYEQEAERQTANTRTAAWNISIGQILFALLAISALYIYLFLFHNEDYNDIQRLLCLVTLIIAFFIFAVVMAGQFTSGIYLVPFAILPILVVVFFDSVTAFFCLVLETLLCGAFVALSFEFVFIEIAAGLTAIYSMRELSKRSQLLKTAVLIFIVYVISYVTVELMQMASLSSFSWKLVGYLAISMVLTSFAYIMIFIVEKVFGLTSAVTLVELADINNDLLRELSEKCPGTFQHSMAVGNLADAAARRIGANVQLVRAGALYHDIGKIANPAFFTENQYGVNPHDNLSPAQSASIIIRHIKDGLKAADKAKLPRVIKDMIAQHHGRSTAKYFYNTYCNAHPGEEVDPEPFTYPGPNPRTKEASLLMMADVVEAASRSLPNHDAESISNLVNRLIDAQVAEGLHKDSPLSFRDITIIKQAFIDRLRTMYHVRIAYPERIKS